MRIKVAAKASLSAREQDGRIQLGPSSGDPPESNSSFWSWQKVLAEGSGRGMPHKAAANALPVEREGERERERERGGGGGGYQYDLTCNGLSG